MSVYPIEITSLETEIMPQINTAAKRLTEPDVQAVFRCLWSNQQPPKRLEFRIIRVPQNGLKLSPPSFEFDGENFPPMLSTWHEWQDYFIAYLHMFPFGFLQMVSTYCFGLR
jgi:hypothetical protein